MIVTLSSLAAQLHYEHSYDKAMHKAKKQHKEIMMMYSAEWCPECQYVKDVVFKDPQVSRYLQKRFIVLNLDTQNDTLPEGFDYVGIPTFFFISTDAKLRGKIIGGSKAATFLKRLKAIR